MPEKSRYNEKSKSYVFVYFFCNIRNNKPRLKSNGLQQTVLWVDKSIKSSSYVHEQINLFLSMT